MTLGKTGIQVSLVGMGTGSHGSGQASNQTQLGVKGFTKVVRHALDRGVTLFDVADQYGSHVYLREALKGVPREKYVIQTKTHATNFADARSHLERYRMELGVDYDRHRPAALHDRRPAGSTTTPGSMDYLRQAKEEKIIRAHGTSCHGMDPLRTSAKEPFVEVDLARINPEGMIMDDKKPDEVASRARGDARRRQGRHRHEDPRRRRVSRSPSAATPRSATCSAWAPSTPSSSASSRTEQIDDLLKRTGDAIATLGGGRKGA